MDLEKIGKFISKKRQDNSYTQESLAEKLNISNHSISKWERGVCLPDANNMAKLCKLFDISYNELFIPKYSSVYFAMHLGHTRYMTCSKCHRKSWQKKIA